MNLSQTRKTLIRKFAPLTRLVTRCIHDDLTTRAAALSYYLVFSIFPLLILFSLIIGSLHIDIAALNTFLSHVLPADMTAMLKSYLEYVTRTFDVRLLIFALVFSVYFPWRFIRSLMDGIRIAYRQQQEDGVVKTDPETDPVHPSDPLHPRRQPDSHPPWTERHQLPGLAAGR